MSDAVPILIRSFEEADQAACAALYVDGLLQGKLADNDSGLDIDNIFAAYMIPDGCHFWVAVPENEPQTIVGMIGVQQDSPGVGEIRRLRVRTDYRRRGIGSRLLETAIRFCHDHQYLKITLDTFLERDAAVRLFEKFRFRHSRTKQVHDRELLYFYLDLYTQERADEQGR
jgi:ribosomal protein S18 acetylase RimI-like enzyme